MKTTFALALILAVSLSACSKTDTGNSQTQNAQQAAGNTQATPVTTGGTMLDPGNPNNIANLDGQPITVAGVTFTPLSGWRTIPASGMRAAQYYGYPAQGDRDSASLVVFYFGPQGGGGVEANIERWIGQMAMPDGSDPHSKARKLDFVTTDGLKAHLVEVVGTYNPGSMGGGMGTPAEAKAGYRMEGVVLECPAGNLFFKLTGPDKTVQHMIPGLQTMIMAAKKS